MTDAIFDFTDTTKTPFVVKPHTTNGPLIPSSAIPLQPLAVQADTSLVFIGKGVPNYGELVQQNFLYLLENFANPTAPALPIEGQNWFNNAIGELSVYNGSSWNGIVLYDNVTQNLDMATLTIQNLGDAVNPTDALNKQTGDLLYVNADGDIVTGTLEFTGAGAFIELTNAPVLPLHATNKAYVDAAVISGGAGTFVQITGDTMTGLLTLSGAPTDPLHAATKQYVDDTVVAASGGLGSLFVAKTGDTMTGSLIISTGNLDLTSGTVITTGIFMPSGLLSLANGTTVSMGNNVINDVADPSNPQDAATKQYVDGGINASAIVGGFYDSLTNLINLERAPGFGSFTLTGEVSPLIHEHITEDVFHTVPPTSNASYVREQLIGSIDFPDNRTNNVISLIDSAMYGLTRPQLVRQMFTQTVPGTTTFVLTNGSFTVGSNRLMVSVNGIKQYADEHAVGYVPITPTVNLEVDTGLTPSTLYSFDLDIDGTPYAGISITTGTGPVTFYDLFVLISVELSTLVVPASVQITNNAIQFISHSKGSGSSVTITDVSLFAAITGAGAAINSSITTDYSYSESGTFRTASSTFVFNVAPSVGAVIEALIIPGR